MLFRSRNGAVSCFARTPVNASGFPARLRYTSKALLQYEPYLLELVRYIHLNPLRAGIVEELKTFDAYPYCGHSALMGKVARGFQDVDYQKRS